MPATEILMLVQSGVTDDARIRREVEILSEEGHSVTVIGSRPPSRSHAPLPARVEYTFASVEGAPDHRRSGLYRSARWLLLPEHRVRTQRSFARAASSLATRFDFDIVHAHDYPTLPVAHEIARGCPVVYDSHECWSGRMRHGRPEPLRRRRQRSDEASLARRSAAVVTVSDSLADWMAVALDIPRPTVVRNTFPSTDAPSTGSGTPRGIVYAGRIAPGRDLAAAMEASSPLRMVFAGPVEAGFAVSPLIDHRGVVPLEQIDTMYREEGLALISLEDNCLNHRLALPNKLFQAVANGVPVVAADLPAIRSVVDSHGIGTLYTPGDVRSLEQAIRSAIDSYSTLRDNVIASLEDLTIGPDARRLIDLYRAI